MMVVLYPTGRCIWTSYAYPDTLLTTPLRIAAVSLCLLICSAVVEPHSGHPLSMSD